MQRIRRRSATLSLVTRYLAAVALVGVVACGAAEDDEPLAGYDVVAPPGSAASAPEPSLPDRPAPPRDADVDAAPADPRCPRADWGPARTFQLVHGAFPDSGHPDVAVSVPAGHDPCSLQGAVVFFHGFKNCVANVIGDEPTPCTPGQPSRSALGLASALEASDANAILIAVELKYDQASGAPGALANAGGLYDLLDELYTEHLSAWFERDVAVVDLDRIVLASHSGGYVAVARALDRGGLPNVSGVMLFDSLYGELATYEDFTLGQLERFDLALPDSLRFAMAYTGGGGTAEESRALGQALESALEEQGRAEALRYDDTTATLDDDAFEIPLLVKRSALSHDGVVPYYFPRFVAASGFARR